MSDSKQQRISAVLLSDGRKIEIHANEDENEQKASERDPVIYENLTEFSDEDLKQAMKSEMESLESFETKEDVPLTSVEDSVISTAMTLLWVFVWKGFVKGRLCVRGYNQTVSDLDDTYASTPVIYVLRILIVMALSRGWLIQFYDISTAFSTCNSKQ